MPGYAEFPMLEEALVKRGIKADDIENLLGRNYLRVLGQSLAGWSPADAGMLPSSDSRSALSGPFHFWRGSMKTAPTTGGLNEACALAVAGLLLSFTASVQRRQK
jgi:hypothetical protein